MAYTFAIISSTPTPASARPWRLNRERERMRR
jgi:hypothetical protein